MERYVGLDAHAQTCTLAVVGPSGKRLTSRVVETNGRALREAIGSIAGRVHLCLEEGTQSTWLYEILEPHMAEIVVAMPAQTKGSKDDLRDAWARAEELRIGAVRRVYKAPKHLTALRSAACAYWMATQDVVRTKNRLKAVLRARGVLADSDLYEKEARAKWLEQLPSGHRELAGWVGRELDQLMPLREQAEEWLAKEAKTHPIRDRGGQWVRAEVRQTRGLTRKRAAGAQGDLQGRGHDRDRAVGGRSARLPAH